MKFVDADLAQNKDAVARFHREAQAASAVESAHIVEIFDAGFADDSPFLVMELLRGEDLGHRIRRCGRLELGGGAPRDRAAPPRPRTAPTRRASSTATSSRTTSSWSTATTTRTSPRSSTSASRRCAAPTALRPHTLTRQGTVLGTPFYMSPEQAQALPDVDGGTDLWAVGAILYECLTGHPPHSGGSYEQVIVNICMKDALDVRMSNPAVPEPIARVIAEGAHAGQGREVLLRARFPGRPGRRRRRAARVTAQLERRARGAHDERSRRPRADAGEAADAGRSQHRAGSDARGARERLEGGLVEQRAHGRARPAAARVRRGGAGRAGWRAHRRGPSRAPLAGGGTAATAPALPTQVSVELRTNAEGALFTVDGVALADRTLRGRTGETKRVRIEASGYTPVDKEVTLQDGNAPIEVLLHPLPTAVTPAPPPAEATTAAPVAPAPAPKAEPSHEEGDGAPLRGAPQGRGRRGEGRRSGAGHPGGCDAEAGGGRGWFAAQGRLRRDWADHTDDSRWRSARRRSA